MRPSASMETRNNIFCIHSWDDADSYERMRLLLAANESGIADYSVPPWKAVEGDDDVVEERLRFRIQLATAVVVINSPGLHRREVSGVEMRAATEMNKRIIVLQPHDNFHHPIPDALTGKIYRVCRWRSDVLGRAIRGEYAQDSRVFDTAEMVDIRELATLIAFCTGAASFGVIAHHYERFVELERELATWGVTLDWRNTMADEMVTAALVGAALSAVVVGLLTRDMKATMLAAAGGGLVGAAVGAHRAYRACLHGTGHLRVLTIEPCP